MRNAVCLSLLLLLFYHAHAQYSVKGKTEYWKYLPYHLDLTYKNDTLYATGYYYDSVARYDEGTEKHFIYLSFDNPHYDFSDTNNVVMYSITLGNFHEPRLYLRDYDHDILRFTAFDTSPYLYRIDKWNNDSIIMTYKRSDSAKLENFTSYTVKSKKLTARQYGWILKRLKHLSFFESSPSTELLEMNFLVESYIDSKYHYMYAYIGARHKKYYNFYKCLHSILNSSQ